MDLMALDTKTKSNDGVWIEIIDPATGENFGLRWKIAGMDSDLFADFSKRMLANSKMKKAAKESDENVDYDIEMLAALTLGWEDTGNDSPGEGKIVFNGEVLTFSAENAKKVLAAIPVIKRQVNAQVLRVQNFLSERSKGSSGPSDHT